MSKTPDPANPKELFKAALEKKKSQNSRRFNQSSSDGNSKVHSASGNKPKLFRRKSG